MNLPTPSKLTLAFVAAALSLTGCASGTKAPTARRGAAAAPRAEEQFPVIVRLVGRHYTVTASSGPAGVVYSAEGRDGNLVVANASLEELRRRHPEVYEQIVPGIATKGEAENLRRRDTAEDASLGGPIPVGHLSQPTTGLGMRGEMLMMDARR